MSALFRTGDQVSLSPSAKRYWYQIEYTPRIKHGVVVSKHRNLVKVQALDGQQSWFAASFWRPRKVSKR